eukprot:Filipodium_phascolosomae@DN13_c0_g1_i1.p1
MSGSGAAIAAMAVASGCTKAAGLLELEVGWSTYNPVPILQIVLLGAQDLRADSSGDVPSPYCLLYSGTRLSSNRTAATVLADRLSLLNTMPSTSSSQAGDSSNGTVDRVTFSRQSSQTFSDQSSDTTNSLNSARNNPFRRLRVWERIKHQIQVKECTSNPYWNEQLT